MSASDAKVPEDQEKSRRELLLKVYSAALDEVRFNINLSWDRTKFFLLLNSGLIAAGIGLLKLGEGTLLISLFLLAFFLLSVGVSLCGLQTVAVGKRYYREAVYTKTLVEKELGLLEPLPGVAGERANLSIAVTRGQRNHHFILSERTGEDGRTSTGTTAFYTQLIFWFMIVIEACAAVASVIYAMLKVTP